MKPNLTDQEKRTLARMLNLARRQLDQAAKRAIIADQLREMPRRSNNWIGKQLGVHHATVAAVRASLEATCQIDKFDRTEGADGKYRPSTYSNGRASSLVEHDGANGYGGDAEDKERPGPPPDLDRSGRTGWHEPSYQGQTDVWLTPRSLLEALGTFDLDPCSPAERPWDTAKSHYSEADDGLHRAWTGRVYLNPPYGPQAQHWLRRMAEHGDGIALTYARTETSWFAESVWGAASALLFLRGRVRFCRPDGTPAVTFSVAPSVLIAYDPPGEDRNREVLRTCGLDGFFVPLDRPSASRDPRTTAPDDVDEE